MPGGGVLEIFAFEPKLPPAAIPWNRVGLTHFSFNVRNLQKWHDDLKAKGVEIVSPPERRRAATRSSSYETSTAT